MKYLRKFTEDDHYTSDIEDLEDYLQEIFDKYHIKKIDLEDTPPMAYPTYKVCSSNLGINFMKRDYISIFETGAVPWTGQVNKKLRLYTELIAMKPFLMKRLGQELDIKTFDSHRYTSYRIEDDVVSYKIEGVSIIIKSR
jgi:hypothetical protein